MHRILAYFEAVGVLVHERVGRKRRLRHPLEEHFSAGGLLGWISSND